MSFVRIWIVLSSALVAGGWVLSAVGALNGMGYGLLLAPLAGWLFLFVRRHSPRQGHWTYAVRQARKIRRRFSRPLPLAFFLLTAVIALGGFLNEPAHADGLHYRVPRVLHWLHAERWHWIHSADFRMNIVSCGFEWLSAPLILLVRSDRFLFLINFISFLMLPGLLFAFLRTVGIRPRIAWAWMWVFPSGWCFAMQAGSLGNDAFSAIYALAAVYLALHAAEKRRVSDLLLSMLACALMTGTKQTNLPLFALWAIAAAPASRLLFRHPVATFATFVVAVLASAVPMIYFDLKYAGTWTGWQSSMDYSPKSPWSGILGNSFIITIQNLCPPIFPMAGSWNAAMLRFVQTPFGSNFNTFEGFGQLNRAISQNNAPLGLGLFMLLIVSVLAARRWRRSGAARITPGSTTARWLRVAPWLLLLVFMSKVGACHPGRYLSPYYAFFLPSILASADHLRVVRTRWWNVSALLLLYFTTFLLVVSRERPVWPADTVTRFLEEKFGRNAFLQRVRNSYTFARDYRRVVLPLAELLPAEERRIGLANNLTHLEVPLWLPFGTRSVVRISPDDPPELVRQWGIRYVVVDPTILRARNLTIADWATKYGAEIVGTAGYRQQPDFPEEQCYLVRLREPLLPP